MLARLVHWYDEERLHGALGYLLPARVYRGDGEARKEERRRKLRRPGTVVGRRTWACNKAPSPLGRGRPLLTLDPQMCHCR